MVIQPRRTTERMRRHETAKHPSESGCQANAGSPQHMGCARQRRAALRLVLPVLGSALANQGNQQGRMQLLDWARAHKMQLQELGPRSDV